jgi:Methyltransferase domain
MAHFRSLLDNPAVEIPKRLGKFGVRWKRRVVRSREYLAGNYTEQSINLSWDGKPQRYDLINALVAKNGYKSYLEIGCRDDSTFDVIDVRHKVGVDPASGGTLRMTSDEFFSQNQETFDIIFIDGLHTYEQVLVDILNSAKVLNPGGVIVMHDCLPTSCYAQYDYQVSLAWNGDVWKSFLHARTLHDLDAATCLIDHGVGVIKKRPNSKPLELGVADFKKLNYAFLVSNYGQLMNTMSFDEVMRFAE